jgi:hypothetical protein
MIEPEMTASNILNLKNRLKQYNDKHNTAHSITTIKTKGLDRYKVNFSVSYFPIKLELQRKDHSLSFGLTEDINNKPEKEFNYNVNQSSLKRLTGTLFKDKLFDNQISDLRTKISKLNDKNAKEGIYEVYRVENVKQVGESPQFTYDVFRYPGKLNIEEKLKRSKNNDTANNLNLSNRTDKLNNLGDQLSLFQLNKLKSKAPIEKLDSYLLDFVSKFGFSSEQFNDFKEKFGVDALGATDLLNKTIYYTSNRNDETVPEEVGHAIIMLLGENRPIVKDLLNEISKWSEFQEIKKEYDPLYNNDKQVRIEAVGKLLAKSLVKQYKIKGIEKSFIEKVLNLFNSIINEFNTMYNGVNYSAQLADKIAVHVLNGDYDFISTLVPATELLNYDLAIENNEHAKDIINEFGTKLDNKLVGSLAIAAQGENIYRDSKEPIHDLDFTVDIGEQKKKDLYKKLEEFRAIPIHNGWGNEYKNYSCYAFFIPKKGLKATVKKVVRGWVHEVELTDESGNIVPSNSQNVIGIDFFIYEKAANKDKFIGDFMSWQHIYQGKIALSKLGDNERMFQRSKDQTDYILAVPLNRDLFSKKEFVYFQKEKTNVEPYIKNETKHISSKTVSPVVLNTIATKLKELGVPVSVKSSEDLKQKFNEQHSKASAFLRNNIIYLNSDKATLDSPMHEYAGHIFLNYLKTNEPDNFKKVIELSLQTDITSQISRLYPELTDPVDLGQEVFSTLIGLENQDKLMPKDTSLFQSILSLFKNNYIFKILNDTFKKVFGIDYDVEINYNSSLSEIMNQVSNDLFDNNTSLFKDVNQYIKENIKNSLTDTHSQEEFEQELIDMGLIQQVCKI